MALNYAKLFNRRVTPQSRPIPGSTQVANSGGGYSWQVDDWTRFDRFLILGAEGGTYYIGERDLVKQNHDAIVRCIKLDGVRAVKRIVEISDSGRAPRNDRPWADMQGWGRAHGRKTGSATPRILAYPEDLQDKQADRGVHQRPDGRRTRFD